MIAQPVRTTVKTMNPNDGVRSGCLECPGGSFFDDLSRFDIIIEPIEMD
jgi:hypothetical protein